MRKHYIEYRVYLKDGIKVSIVNEVALELQDYIADRVSDDNAPKIFTQDVTYELRMK